MSSDGLVVCRQRPGSARGTLLLTLEDEQGFVNVVLREKTLDRYRQLLRTVVMLEVKGKLEGVGPVLNVLASQFAPLRTPTAGFRPASHDYR